MHDFCPVMKLVGMKLRGDGNIVDLGEIRHCAQDMVDVVYFCC